MFIHPLYIPHYINFNFINMASNTNTPLIKNSKGLGRPIIPAHILNNATIKTPLNHSFYPNYIFQYTFNLTEAFCLTEISLQPAVIIHNNNRSAG
jgi:hypothetical protein